MALVVLLFILSGLVYVGILLKVWCACVLMQIRVYPLDPIRNRDFDPEPMEAAFIHRLPSKMSSIAWSPYDEVCRNPHFTSSCFYEHVAEIVGCTF